MKKVKVLTFHWPLNYGAVLQAYALCEVLKKMECEVEIIDYRPLAYFRELAYGLLAKDIRRIIKRLSLIIPFRKFRRDFLPISKKTYIGNIKNIKDSDSADEIYICGSDQIWNSKILGGIDRNYFLKFAPNNCRKLSYAASMGGVKFDPRYLELLKADLARFHAISVREEFAQVEVEHLTNKKPTLVLDPSLLLHDYSKIMPAEKQYYRDYILAFCIQSSTTFEKIVCYLKKYFKIPVLNVGNIFIKNADRHIYSLGPGQWLRLLQDAKIVVTNSFHGVAFSINLKRQFLCVPLSGKVDTRNDRLKTLLKALNIEDRLISSTENISVVFKAPIDYHKIHKDLNRLKIESLELLQKNL